jgi:hypothetical protein
MLHIPNTERDGHKYVIEKIAEDIMGSVTVANKITFYSSQPAIGLYTSKS